MRIYRDIVVIGAGLFGQIIAKELMESKGQQVILVDAGHKNAGSKPAACLMKPSWFSSLGKDVYDPALALLDRLYGVQELKFKLGPTKVGGVMWVNPRHVLSLPVFKAKVTYIIPGYAGWTVCTDEGFIDCKKVIIAAGVWTNSLIQVENLKGQAGAAFTWSLPKGEDFEPFIRPWAPYKQLVGFKRGPRELWVGDGTSIKMENWTGERTTMCRSRCAKAVDKPIAETKTLYGIRPYVKDAKPCYLKMEHSGLWVATGGAKNGTLAAAWCAHTISETM